MKSITLVIRSFEYGCRKEFSRKGALALVLEVVVDELARKLLQVNDLVGASLGTDLHREVVEHQPLDKQTERDEVVDADVALGKHPGCIVSNIEKPLYYRVGKTYMQIRRGTLASLIVPSNPVPYHQRSGTVSRSLRGTS